MTEKQTPNFKHDCDTCIFLGLTGVEKDNDVYLALHSYAPTLIVRWSNKPSDNSSFPLSFLIEHQVIKENMVDLDIALQEYKDKIMLLLCQNFNNNKR